MELFAELEPLIKKHEISSFKSWLHTVMRNKCLLALRADKKMTHVSLNEAVTAAEDKNELAQLRERDLQQLESAIESLKEEQRKCIKLFYIEKNSYKVVSEMTGLSVAQVRSSIQNGRRNLQLRLQNHADQHR